MIRTKQIGQALNGLLSPVLKGRFIKITVKHVPSRLDKVVNPLFHEHLPPPSSPPTGAQLPGGRRISPFETLAQTRLPSFSSSNNLKWTPDPLQRSE
jgi:hypothetical protein